MKKIFLSFLLCLGVGFTMVGSPAQVGDDGNNQAGTSVGKVVADESRDKGICHTNPLIRCELKVKNLDRVLKSVSMQNLFDGFTRDEHLPLGRDNGTHNGNGNNRLERKSSVVVDNQRVGKAWQTHDGKPIIIVPDPPIIIHPTRPDLIYYIYSVGGGTRPITGKE
jgi:hypothetical protein